jgi:hypothetical protein
MIASAIPPAHAPTTSSIQCSSSARRVQPIVPAYAAAAPRSQTRSERFRPSASCNAVANAIAVAATTRNGRRASA